MKESKINNEDFVLLTSVYEGLGREKFLKLIYMLNELCINELGISDCQNCPRTMADKPEDICPICICNKLDELYKK